jgi:DNA repair protein RadC
MPIVDWPAAERPREKLLARGAGNLSDAELLAIFLRTGVKGKSAVDLARELLYYFGDLRALLTADQKGHCAGKGLGEAKFVQLQAVLEIARRHLLETVKRGDPRSNPNETRNYIAMRLRDYAFEVFVALFLDNRYRVDSFRETVSRLIDGTSVHRRDVVR